MRDRGNKNMKTTSVGWFGRGKVPFQTEIAKKKNSNFGAS
jgi:hypothetical protein